MDNSVMTADCADVISGKHSTQRAVSTSSVARARQTVYSLMCVLSLAFRQLETGSANTLHREKKNYDSS